MIRNILMTIEYDGTDFSGWQIQPGSRTVQGELQNALKKLCGQDIKLNATSRTDAGVHALGQRASFKGELGIPVNKIAPVLNNMLSGDIKITEAVEMPLNFHARFDAEGKKYIYKILNCAEKDIFKRNFYYCFNRTLDVEKMNAAAGKLKGTHDFASFMAMGSTPQESTVRTIYSYRVFERNNDAGQREIILEVSGNGFLYNMVRIMTGTLIDVGLGKLSDLDVEKILISRNRSCAGRTAPPQGLYLDRVYYDKEEMTGGD